MWKFYFILRVFARNLLRGSRQRNIFHISFQYLTWDSKNGLASRFKIQHTTTKPRRLHLSYHHIYTIFNGQSYLIFTRIGFTMCFTICPSAFISQLTFYNRSDRFEETATFPFFLKFHINWPDWNWNSSSIITSYSPSNA